MTSDVARLLAERAEDVCRYLLPNGRRVGREWKAGSVHGEAGDSLGVVLSGDKAGVFADFASGESGDLIGLWKLARGVDTAAAFLEAEDFLGIPHKVNGHANGNGKATERRPEPSHIHPRLGAPSRTWAYTDAYGGILGYVSRFDPKGERKQILPQTFRDGAWVWKGFDEPRPLYGLDALAARPADKVLVVEGEKAADAARKLLPAMVVVTWNGGAQAVAKADITPLRGRVLTLWPDADEPGIKAMEVLAERVGEPCRIVGVDGMPEGWDAADALAEGWDTAKVQSWAKPRLEEWFPEPDVPRGTSPPVVSDYAAAMIEGDWPEPVDLFAKAVLPPLKRDYLPPALERFVFDQSEIIGADPCILAIASLVCAAAVTHDSIQLQPKIHERGWRESARLWGAFVGDPSVRKTPAANRAVSHLKKLNIELAEESQRNAEEHAKRQKAHAAREAEFYKGTAAGKPMSHPGEAPERPKKLRVMTQDATIEAVGVIMQDNSGGILVYQDELAGWFGSMDAYRAKGGKDAAFWLQAYNGGSMAVDRIGRDSMIIPNVSASLLGGIQPSAMRAISANLPDDGLLQRFMIVMAEETEGLGVDRAGDFEAMHAWRSIIDYLISERAAPDADPLRFTAGAYDIARAFEAKIKALAANPMHAERFRYHIGKWPGLFARLCLTYHAIECANLCVPVGGDIDEATAAQVAVFLLEYLKPHTMAFYAQIVSQDDADRVTQRVAGWILAKGESSFTPSDAIRGNRALRSMDDDAKRRLFERLRMMGWIDYHGSTNRFSPRRWNVNPRVHELFTERAAYERDLRGSPIDGFAE